MKRKKYNRFTQGSAPKLLYDFDLPGETRDVLVHAAGGSFAVLGVMVDGNDGYQYGLFFTGSSWALACTVAIVRRRLPIRPSVRAAVLLRDGGRCRVCGSLEDSQLDHIVPWSRGGPDTAENLQCLCGRCNRAKWHRDKVAS